MATNSHSGIVRRSMIPISNAPPEILQHIFKRCLDLRYPNTQPFSSTEAPLLLCGVSRLWRKIAISTSKLWAHISVSIGRETPDKQQPSLQLMKIWIERSGCQPLTLVLQDLGLPSSSPDVANDVLRVFLLHIHRWKSITLILPNHAFPVSLAALELPWGRASLLQIAKIDFGLDPGVALHADTPEAIGLSRLLTSSPHFHTLYWPNKLCTLQFIDIPWAQLTVIDLVPLWRPMSHILEVIRKAPKLRSLSTFIAGGCEVPAPLVLPDLLILWIGTEVDLSPLFRQLTVPSLLNINVFCANTVIPQIDVVNCIVRSGSLVNTAIFKSLRLPKADFVTFLRLSPSLVLLDISNNGEPTITEDILSLLTVRDAPCVCPNLRIIRFLESSVSSVDGMLADMVASRRSATTSAFSPASLSRLSVHFSDTDLPGHGDDIRRLKGLGEAAGFQVWINEPETV